MKELVLKKRLELEEMCRNLHMVPAEDSAIEYVIDAIDCGILRPPTLFFYLVVVIFLTFHSYYVHLSFQCRSFGPCLCP